MERADRKARAVDELKRRGKRMTRQRLLILNGDHRCGKEVYYDAVKADPKIGLATVYRMLAVLEESGVLDRSYQYELEDPVE